MRRAGVGALIGLPLAVVSLAVSWVAGAAEQRDREPVEVTDAAEHQRQDMPPGSQAVSPASERFGDEGLMEAQGFGFPAPVGVAWWSA